MPTRRPGPRDRRAARPEPVTPAEESEPSAEPDMDEEAQATPVPDAPVAGEDGPDAAVDSAADDIEAVEAPPDEESDEAALEELTARRPARRNTLFPLGVNYYPLDAETQGPDDWYAADIDADFAEFARARLTLVRIFLSWRFFEPQVGQYSDAAEERLQELVDAARAHKLQLLVCFFADDRLAEMLDVVWGKKRDTHEDPYLVQRQTGLVQRIVNRYRSESAVFGWDLANEAFCAGFSSAEQMAAWVETMRDAIREVDPTRPIVISCDPETLFRSTGVDAREIIAANEIGVSHVTAAYRAYAAEGPLTFGPSSYLDAFLLRCASSGAPVLLDDVGVHSLDHSHAEEAAHLRCVLYSGIMNRASGALVRRWRDVDVERREPYFRDPFEVLVGVCDIDGEEKPTMSELRSFARVAAHIDLRRYTLTQERTAIVMPDERFKPLPELASLYAPRACLQAFVTAKEAHVPVTVAYESEDYASYSVLVVPSAFQLADATWERLAAFVQGGGSLVYSYGGGDEPQVVRDLFGLEFLGDGGARTAVACRIAQPDVLGPLTSFDARLDVPSYAQISGAGATIVATDATGSPLLTVNQFGQGRAVFLAVPFERAIAQGDPWAVPEAVARFMRTVYGSVAGAAGCGAPVTCDASEVELALFTGEGDDICVLLNHGRTSITANLGFERVVATIADVRGGEPVEIGAPSFGVPLDAGGATAITLTYG